VDWIDDPDSRVNIINTATEDLKGVWRMARQRSDRSENPPEAARDENAVFEHHRQLARYASVGILSSVAYLAIFFLLRSALGIFAANLVAAAATAIVNTAAHTSFTFKAKHGSRRRQAVAVGAFSFAVGIGFTSATLTVAYLIGNTSTTAEGVAILAGMIAASCVRFVLLREWAYRIHTRSTHSSSQSIAGRQNTEKAQVAA
jgi:putative flippase GtrA